MSPDTFQILANLPWTIQLVLGAGFCAYRIAYVGIRQSHKTIDEIFISVSFGLIAAMILHFKITPSLMFGALKLQLPLPLWAFFATITSGVLWRAVGRGSLAYLFRLTSYSWADDTESAWENLQACKARPTQITVETDDGWSLYCTSAYKVKDLPHGPYVLGASGDILMYVDRSEPPNDAPHESKGPRDIPGALDDEWGSIITYLPKERIRAVRIRYEPVTSRVGVVDWMKAVGLRVVAGMRRRLSNDQEQA